MRKHKVESSNIDTVGYDPEESILEIRFRAGGVYRYKDITPIQFARFMNADSHGAFFAEHFRRLPFEKVIPPVTISPE